MVQIVSFLKLKLGKSDEVLTALKQIPQVRDIYFITGEYDIVIMVEAPTGEEIHNLFTDRIEKISGISLSNSHLVMRHWRSP
jgi:DNA-binding Lrp family transcriptional regulator